MYRKYREESSDHVLDQTTDTIEHLKTMHQAASDGDVDTLKNLLQRASINDRDAEGSTALYRAAESGKTQAVQFLLESGAHVNARKRKRWTPLHISAKNNHVAALEALLASGGDVNRGTNRSMTPVMLSAKHGNLEAVQLLVNKGAKVDLGDMFDRSAMIWAIKGGSQKIVEELYMAGADISAEDQFRKSPVIQSVKSDKPEILKYLLDKGVDCNKEEKHYRAPIHMTVSKGRPKCLQILLDYGIAADTPASNERTPLLIAARECRYRLTQMLLESGANPQQADGFGTTPLHELALSSYRPTIRGRKDKSFFDTAFLLIDANANLDALTNAKMFWKPTRFHPQSALEVATKAARCFPLVKLFACAGTNPNKLIAYCHSDPKDLTPLLRQNRQVLDWLEDFYSKPRSLREQCRKIIRRCVGTNFHSRIKSLNIPHGLIEYLHFSDLKYLRDEHSFMTSNDKDLDDHDPDRNSEAEYNPSVFLSEYGDDPNIVDTDSDSETS